MAAAEYFAAPAARPPLSQQNSGPYTPSQPPRPLSSQPGAGGYKPAFPSPLHGQPSPQPYQPSPQFGGVQPPQASQYPQPPIPPPYQPLNNDAKVRFAQNSGPPTPGQHRPSLPSQSTYTMGQPNYQASQGQQLAPFPPRPPVSSGAYQLGPPYAQPQRPPHHHRHSHSDPLESSRAGYSSDPEYSRKHHKSRARRISENSRSKNTDGLLGAAGGSIIGDLIFPGLGTVGGALVGWVGGKDYGKHRKWREEKRDREQERWERKYRHDASRSESRSRSRDDRDYGDESGRRISHVGHDGLLHSHIVPRRTSYD